MADGRKLAQQIWPAINFDTMQSRAWSLCMPEDFRSEDHRPIIQAVLLRATMDEPCVFGELRDEVADAYQVDDKTVAGRIHVLKNGGLLDVRRDATGDRRRFFVTPTKTLVDAFIKYSDHLVDLALELYDQMDRPGRSQRDRKPSSEIYFDVFDHVQCDDPTPKSTDSSAQAILSSQEPLVKERK